MFMFTRLLWAPHITLWTLEGQSDGKVTHLRENMYNMMFVPWLTDDGEDDWLTDDVVDDADYYRFLVHRWWWGLRTVICNVW